MLRHLWQMTRGYRLRPWKSPYLLWRVETWSGIHADRIGFKEFLEFSWSARKDLIRYLHWADRMRQ